MAAVAARCSPVLTPLASTLVARRGVSSQINGIRIEHASLGDRKNPTVLLIAGHSFTMTMWTPLDRTLADAGFHVVKFDNRDMGLSQRFDDVLPDPEAYLADSSKCAYCIDDMADDARAVLDHYGIDQAHVFGASMGGLVAQVFATRYAERCKSLMPCMTAASLNEALAKSVAKDGGAWLEKAQALSAPVGKDVALSEFLDKRRAWLEHILEDAAFPCANEQLLQQLLDALAIDYERGGFDYDGNGGHRQSLAIGNFDKYKSAAHCEALKAITAPTLVLHGLYDPVLPVEAGRDLAATIPGAQFFEYLAGHNFGNHPAVQELIVAAVVEHVTAVENSL